jgi:hypothetical protein
MKTEILFLAILFLTSSTYAATGGVDGGGGKSVVCRDINGKIISAEVLDLYEGRVQYGLAPAISSDPIDQQVQAVVSRLSTGRGEPFSRTVMSYVDFVQTQKVLLPDGTGLLPIDDSHHVVTPKNCQVEQLANFTNQNQILINGEIWNSLDNSNKAALIVHEAIYKVFRMYGATNSIRARKSVAIGFAGGTLTPIWDGTPFNNGKKDEFLNCQTVTPVPGSHFYAFNNSDGELVFQFDYLDGQLMLTKSTLIVDKIPLSKLTSYDHEVTYWSNLVSSTDMFVGVAISLKPVIENGVARTSMKIGIGNMPTAPIAEFICSKYNP